MTLEVARFLRYVFSDCFNAEKSRLKEVRSRNKSAHRIIVGYLGAVYTSIVLGNHPVPPPASRVCSPCSNKVRSTWAKFSFIKTSFQESEHNDDSFRFKRMSALPHSSTAR